MQMPIIDRGVNCPKIDSGKRQLQQVIDGQRRDKRYMRAEDVYYEPFGNKLPHDCLYHVLSPSDCGSYGTWSNVHSFIGS